MLKQVTYFNAQINNWFLTPEVNAAGRLGLFRMLFCWFYLWYLSSQLAVHLSAFPSDYNYNSIWAIEVLPKPLPGGVFEFIESALIVALVLLFIGFRVRLMTAIVLVLGCLLEGYYSSIDLEFAAVFLVFYIPFFMLLSCHWGDTYSLDSLLQMRARKPAVSPADSAWHYALPIRCILVVLGLLFLLSALCKVLGTWLSYPELIANFLLQKNIETSLYQLPVNPLAPLIAKIPIIYSIIHWFTLLFEGGFIFAIFIRKVRYIFFAIALIFHSINAIWLSVTFTTILIVYGLFIDWQALRERWLPKQIAILDKISSKWLKMGAISLAIAIGILWNSSFGIRSIFNLGELLNWHTIWYPILPLSVAWLVVSLMQLLSFKSRFAK